MLDRDIVTRRDLMIARAIEAQEDAAQAYRYAAHCLDPNNWDFNSDNWIGGDGYEDRAAGWQNTAKLAHEVQSDCVRCLLHCSEIWLEQSI